MYRMENAFKVLDKVKKNPKQTIYLPFSGKHLKGATQDTVSSETTSSVFTNVFLTSPCANIRMKILFFPFRSRQTSRNG